MIDNQIPLQLAEDAPRFHHQWLPDTLQVEPGALIATVADKRKGLGHRIVPVEDWGVGNSAEVIAVSPHDPTVARALGFPHADRFLGANDRRTPAGACQSAQPLGTQLRFVARLAIDSPGHSGVGASTGRPELLVGWHWRGLKAH